jgi:hypothetical protein
MKRFALTALLVSCASCAATKAAPAHESKHWTPTERAQVLFACVTHFGTGRFCDCLTEKLEAISPDPDTELTSDDVKTGLAACKGSVEATALSEEL